MASNIMLTRCGFLFEAASLGIGSVLSVGVLLSFCVDKSLSYLYMSKEVIDYGWV